jgi:OOP family OmpA-OmpF porin
MKMKLLGLSILSAVSMSQAASAQEFDDRWYFSGTAGFFFPDSDRQLDSDFLWGAGFGKRLTERFSLDLEYTSTSPDFESDVQNFISPYSLSQDITTIELIGRYRFTDSFYVAVGIGGEDDEFTLNDGLGNNSSDSDSGVVGRLGLGFESNRRKRFDFRVEGGMRYSDAGDFGNIGFCFDDGEGGQNCDTVNVDASGNLDYYLTGSVLVKLGNLPVPVVAAAPIDCSALDGDNDGVNDCNDKCPDSQAGQTIGADGCPVKLVIDLKGVNFDFDKATLRDDSVVILDEAVAVLNKYPQLRVAVDGHTDLCGAADYNQKLSEKRAGTVFQYLVDKGIATDRLVGPTGYGEANPLVTTPDTYPDCKNETNRRTELNVQN